MYNWRPEALAVILLFMEIRFATDAETQDWNAHVLANPDGGSIYQGDEFAEQKKLSGWKPRYLFADELAITVLEKPVVGLGRLWYIPKGPGVTSVVQLGDLMPDLRQFAARHGVFVVKVEPELVKTDDAVKALSELGFIPSKPVQAYTSTILIDLSPDLDTTMANFNQKGRHAVRRAERDGATVKQVESTEENCRIFYDLYAKTAEGSFAIRPFDYYLRFWQRYATAKLGQMFFAYFDGQVIAAAFGMVFGEKSLYKDGASVRERTVYGGSHLLQWHVIQWAKNEGSKIHDLGGSPPSDRMDDESHPFYGFGKFKSSFNKQVTDYIGAYDIVVKPLHYKVWSSYGERLVKRHWWMKHHENWY